MNDLNKDIHRDPISFQGCVAVGITDEMVLYEIVRGMYREMLTREWMSEAYYNTPYPGTLSWATKRFMEYYGNRR